MSGSAQRFILVLSLLLNLGVAGAVGYRAYQHGQWPVLPGAGAGKTDLEEHLKLTAKQRQQWRKLEAAFLAELQGDWRAIRGHREAMVREIFSPQPDRGRIESERAAIAQLQTEQQRRIIGQLSRERDILDAEQRRKLADLLLRQAPASTFEERLHGN